MMIQELEPKLNRDRVARRQPRVDATGAGKLTLRAAGFNLAILLAPKPKFERRV